MKRKVLVLIPIFFAVILAGCAGNPLRQYDKELGETVDLVKNGSLKLAIERQQASNKPGVFNQEPDILGHMELGELLAMDSHHAAARDSWLRADEMVREWEEGVKTDAAKVIGDIGSFLINDKVRRYDGQDYEKVLLSTKLTLSHLMLGNHEDARVEMKKTYEREKLIESFREQEYEQLHEEAEEKGETIDAQEDFEGYPMAELDLPEVTRLKNGFQNAFAHYLAGYFFEVTGEPSLAAPGYRNALTLAPDSSLIKQNLTAIGRKKPAPNESDVLFVIESGFAPAWKSVMVPIPIPRSNGVVVTPLSFPRLAAENPGFVPSSVQIANQTLPVETLSNIDHMARRMLKDQLPTIILRTIARAAVKSVAQEQANKSGLVVGLITAIVSVVTEQADERGWRTLPERISIARAILPHGRHTLEFATESGTLWRQDVEIGERFSIIPLRIVGDMVYLGQPSLATAADTDTDTADTDTAAAAAAATPLAAEAKAKAAAIAISTPTATD